jgi:site-specific DNA-cytosine methylase
LGFSRSGFEIAAHVEKDANCRKLLAAKWPDAIALDDVCTAGAHNLPACDVVVGGSPCQSFSVAGLRKGLNDPRGNLLLEYLRVVSELRPKWMLWENVPGVLSDKTKALNNMLDALEELGYIVDVEIIDAQWNGVAQRRRRVFVCGRSVESLASETTSTSALIIAQCLTEILHGILDGMLEASGEGPSESVLPKLSSDGLTRRIRLFKMHGETGSLWQTWRSCLDAAFQKSATGPRGLAADLGANRSTCTEDGQQSGAEKDDRTTSTGPSWSDCLDAAFDLVKSYTTSTATNSTTRQTIFMCSWAVLHIARLIARLNTSCPPFFAAASSSLTALKEYIEYARQTSSDLFGDASGIRDWVDFIRQAEQASDALGDIGVECFGTLLPLTESLRGHPAPRRETGEGVAGDARLRVAGSMSSRASGGGGGPGAGTDEAAAGYLIPAIMPTLRSGTTQDGPGHGARHDSSPCADRGMDVVAVPVAFEPRFVRTSGGQPTTGPHPCLRADANTGDGKPCVATMMKVRRLTPTECERLQGFPDGWTAGFSDSVRYRMLGNAVAVPVAQWIAARLAKSITGRIEETPF